MRQRLFPSRLRHLIPAGLPSGIPGIGDDIEMYMQHAAHPGLQVIFLLSAHRRNHTIARCVPRMEVPAPGGSFGVYDVVKAVIHEQRQDYKIGMQDFQDHDSISSSIFLPCP